MSEEVSFVTLSESLFFPGTVALLNSLRLTGNRGDLLVVDLGLTPDERAALEPYARVVGLPEGAAAEHAWLLKPAAATVQRSGIVVMIDSDMIITGSLDRAIAAARSGRIFVYPDHHGSWERRFPEWEELLGLRAPVRSGQMYTNSGFIALSVDAWPEFWSRLRELCARIPPGFLTGNWDRPFSAGDQDATNALLMSEIPADAVEIGPAHDEVFWDALREVEILDPERLACLYERQPVRILHYSFTPKAWERSAWRRFRIGDAYVRLLRRVLLSDDVALRLESRRVPFWLRRGLGPAIAARSLSLFMDIDTVLQLLSRTRRIRKAPRRISAALLAILRS